VLVNNAGSVIDYADFRELSLETWEKAFTLNTQVPFELGRHAWPHMASQGGGRIINISSISVKYAGSANSMHYAASKAAMESISNSFAKEGAIDNILSNTIRCGVIDTAMRKNVPNYTEKKFTERLKLIPLGKTGSPADVAALVLFLASDSASFITGDTITMAGGE
jgi:NAD(P)-dependent dehydrogenase (short-subunit alcohol dehydrogenase family)